MYTTFEPVAVPDMTTGQPTLLAMMQTKKTNKQMNKKGEYDYRKRSCWCHVISEMNKTVYFLHDIKINDTKNQTNSQKDSSPLSTIKNT